MHWRILRSVLIGAILAPTGVFITVAIANGAIDFLNSLAPRDGLIVVLIAGGALFGLLWELGNQY